MPKITEALYGIQSAHKFIVGFDLGWETAGISYMPSQDKEFADSAVTVSTITGGEKYTIPTVLAKDPGSGRWFFGEEALLKAENGACLVDRLLERAINGEDIEAFGEHFDAVTLLTLFMSRCMGLLVSVGGPEKTDALMVTTPEQNAHIRDVIAEAVSGLKLSTRRVAIQSYSESLYSYIMRQPEEVYRHGAMLMELRKDEIAVLRMERSTRTRPVAIYVSEERYPLESDALKGMNCYTGGDEERLKEFDRHLLVLMKKICKGSSASGVFLIGDGFEQSRIKETIRFLCAYYRVFQGTNLYSKGACYSLQEKLREIPEANEHIFLGSEKLAANIGTRIFRQGEEVYIALLDAGCDWFDAEGELDIYVSGESRFDIYISDLIKGTERKISVPVSAPEDIPERFHVQLSMEGPKELIVTFTCRGFGAYMPASGEAFEERISL